MNSQRVILTIGIVIVSLITFLAVFGPVVAPYSPVETSADLSLAPPAVSELPGLLWATVIGHLEKPVHWFGTDAAGLDVFSRVIAAPRTDLSIALAVNVVSLGLGTLIGLVCGYFRNQATEAVMRAADLLQSFPALISGMIFVALSGRTLGSIIITLGILYTPIYIRLTRVEVMTQISRGYVEASRAIGLDSLRIALWHVLPNSLAPSIIQSSVTIGFAILLTAGLSFVGAGVRPPTPEWGLMISAGTDQLVQGEWWPSVGPGIAISLTVFGFAALANGLEALYRR